MEIVVQRKESDQDSTIGTMSINGEFFCYTLEDPVREVKIPNVTAIPEGRYEVIINFSNRFQRQMPLLLNVPNYEGVRIHYGNYSKDTDGCILLGMTEGKDFIGQSRNAFKDFMEVLSQVSTQEKIFITIHNYKPTV